MMGRRCPICGRPSVEGSVFCELHEVARMKVVESYEVWKSRYGGMDWKVYLKKLSSNEKTGIWAKEVAEYLLGGDGDGS
ncbi:MAG: hypothetical protein J7L50_00525 [Candidatus Odinarchaeota archaeon]|nr:hypothetical protein [Candidatus Odinarchaeota archaeon]